MDILPASAAVSDLLLPRLVIQKLSQKKSISKNTATTEESTVTMTTFTDNSVEPSIQTQIHRTPARRPRAAVSRLRAAKRNTPRQMTVILAAYLAFWTPYYFLSMSNIYFEWEGFEKEWVSILNVVICANTIGNPLIYSFLKPKPKPRPTLPV